MKNILTLSAASLALGCAAGSPEIKDKKQPTVDAPLAVAEQLRTDFKAQALSRLTAELVKNGQALDETAQCTDTRDDHSSFGFDSDSLKNDAYDAQLAKSLKEQNLTFITQYGFGGYGTRDYMILVETQEGKKEVYKTHGTLPAQGISSQRAWVCMQALPMTLEKMEGWGEKEFEDFIKKRSTAAVVTTSTTQAEHVRRETTCIGGDCVSKGTTGKLDISSSSIEPPDTTIPDKLPTKKELAQWSAPKLRAINQKILLQLRIAQHQKSVLEEYARVSHSPQVGQRLKGYDAKIKFYTDFMALISAALGK